jgi:hypothetical protein
MAGRGADAQAHDRQVAIPEAQLDLLVLSRHPACHLRASGNAPGRYYIVSTAI